MKSFNNWLLETINATVYSHSSSKGASIETSDDHDWDKENTQPINIDQIINYERKSKMLQPKSIINKNKIKEAILANEKLPPILLRQINSDNYPQLRNPSPELDKRKQLQGINNPQPTSFKYQVIDGHHRFWAYKDLQNENKNWIGYPNIPAVIVPPENIQYKSKWMGD